MTDYPKVMRHVSLHGRQIRKTCCKCLESTQDGYEVRFSVFRGEDEVVKMCKPCQKGSTDEQLIKVVYDREQEKANANQS